MVAVWRIDLAVYGARIGLNLVRCWLARIQECFYFSRELSLSSTSKEASFFALLSVFFRLYVGTIRHRLLVEREGKKSVNPREETHLSGSSSTRVIKANSRWTAVILEPDLERESKVYKKSEKQSWEGSKGLCSLKRRDGLLWSHFCVSLLNSSPNLPTTWDWGG